MIRTLVVEDDPVVAEVNSGYLQRVAGFAAVGVARSGREAIAAVDKQPVDLVLLDFYLPDMSGLDVCRTTSRLSGRSSSDTPSTTNACPAASSPTSPRSTGC